MHCTLDVAEAAVEKLLNWWSVHDVELLHSIMAIRLPAVVFGVAVQIGRVANPALRVIVHLPATDAYATAEIPALASEPESVHAAPDSVTRP